MLHETKINIKFNGELKQNQINILNECMKNIQKNNGGIISLPCGYGKCLAKGTKVLMFDRTIKNVEDIKIGDELVGDDFKIRKVLSLGQGIDYLYDIIDNNDECHKYTANGDHILTLQETDTINSTIYDISIKDYIKNGNQIMDTKNTSTSVSEKMFVT